MSREQDDQIPRRRFYEVQERAHAVLSEYRGMALGGGAPESYKPVMGRACLDYVAALRKHRSEQAIKDEWAEIEGALAPIREAVGRTIEVKVPAPGDTDAKVDADRPAIEQIPFEYLVRVIEELDDLAKNLGLSETVRDETPEDQADLSDLRHLLQARGQTDAVENLPGDPDDGEAPEPEVAD